MLRATLVGLLVWTATATCFAAPPQLTTVQPRGWKPGVNEVVVQGAGLTPETRFLVDLPGAVVALKPETKPAPNQMVFLVTLSDRTPTGVYEARVASDEGISNSQMLLVDSFANTAEIEPNNALPQATSIAALPAGVEGRLSGSESDWFALDGKQGQRLVVEMVGRRLGCNIKPVLTLYDAQRLELAAARTARGLGGDCRLVVTLPADGRYYIEVHDLVYRGDGNQYRLLVGDLQVADAVFPLAARRGSEQPIQFAGGSLTAPVTQLLAVSMTESAAAIGLKLPDNPLASPLPMVLLVSELETVAEQPRAANAPQVVPLPVGIDGRLAADKERDTYQLAVQPGTRLRIAVQSERLGTPLDAQVQLKNDQGALLLTQDDGPGTADPDFFYVVPANVTTLLVEISDVLERGGDRFAYRLEIEPMATGDFELSLLNPLVNVPAGGSASIRVRAVRRDFDDPIRLKLLGDIPAGTQFSGTEIGEGVTDTFLSLTAPADAPLTAGKWQIVGEAGPIDRPSLRRVAKLTGQPTLDAFPWLRDRLAGAIAKPRPLALQVQGPALLLRGMEYTAQVRATRAEGQTGPINLVVQTSQVPVAGQAQLALVPNLTIAENASEGMIKINVPSNAPDIPLTYIVTGTLLDGKDKRTPVSTAETPSVSARIVMPFTVELTSIPAELQRGARNRVLGKITRVAPFAQPLTLTVTGIPGNFRTLTTFVVPPDVNEFELPIVIPPAQPAAPLPNVKLTATWATIPPLAAPALDIPLTIAAGDPPPVLEIYDEGQDFVAALTEGEGTATAVADKPFSGRECVEVKAMQRGRVALPGLNVRIVETPSAGQYRYLRFAWRKTGGTGALLQLGVNNQLGPASAKGTDYRYLAGTDTLNTKAVKVADAIPAEWTVVTRDLFADHGAFNLTGLALTPLDGEALYIDHIYLAKTEADLPPLPTK